jgi:hypothetical protein
MDHDRSPIEGLLEALQPVRVEVVGQVSSQTRLFQFLLQHYHY